ncbi:SapC family protein [Cyanobium sp. AMD-g]|uniref:SapC family protein n=1 Tax=Cyanobium sp. AMD-g TaxID=2823699 RepID=UPI0020CD9191|nr:SapC family protein [Cyanobium sp. AMD-g]MCP9931174.1 SapC family protein [Cyanobium sp. AMD-g]
MTKQLQFYENAVPVSAQRHAAWCLERQSDYAYASQSNVVPLTAVEFPFAAMEYSIVFVGTEEAPTPVVLLGVKPEENLYLEDGHRWKARYIPAFVRRYPFVFAKGNEANTYTLCIDESYGGWNQEGRGKALFDENGSGTEYLKGMMKFVTDFQREIARTSSFCQKLKQLDLLDSMAARFKLADGKDAEVKGFMAVDRQKLITLPGDTLVELAGNGMLELIYAHLLSMRHFGELTETLAAGSGG